jgi:hypothetical protein
MEISLELPGDRDERLLLGVSMFREAQTGERTQVFHDEMKRSGII